MSLEGVGVVVDALTLAAAGDAVQATRVEDAVAAYVVQVVRATRAAPAIAVGASPRAAVHLLAAAKAAARMSGRDFVTPDDVAAVVPAVLAHRLVLTPEAELERLAPGTALEAAVGRVAVPR